MTTALGIVTSAMRKNGVLTKGEAPSADEAADGFEMLNDLLAGLSNDSLIVYARTLENFTLVGGTSSYTIGPSATFNTTRPVKIISAYVRSGSIDYPLTVVSDESFSTITYKSTGGIPEFLNYSNAYPTATIKLYPSPSSAYELFILTEKPLTAFSSLSTVVSLPPGWERMLKHNLAMEMAPEFGVQTPAEVVEIAKESKADIKSAVMSAKKMDWNSGIGYDGNIYTGWS